MLTAYKCLLLMLTAYAYSPVASPTSPTSPVFYSSPATPSTPASLPSPFGLVFRFAATLVLGVDWFTEHIHVKCRISDLQYDTIFANKTYYQIIFVTIWTCFFYLKGVGFLIIKNKSAGLFHLLSWL